MEEKIVVLILAAGASERFGKAKQLLVYNKHSLVINAVRTGLEAKIGPCIVVTGSNNKAVEKELKEFKGSIRLCYNSQWKEGMGASIRNGIKFINKNIPEAYGVVILLCDQPLIGSDYLINMTRSHFSSRKKIIASGYGGSWGVPAFFHHQLFGYLEELTGDHGAKSVINRLKQNVHVLPNQDAEIDIDTFDDYDRITTKAD